jgi:hypothetical protein
MARGPLTFKQSDLTRAIRAALKAGVERAWIDVDGRVVLGLVAKPIETEPEPEPKEIVL